MRAAMQRGSTRTNAKDATGHQRLIRLAHTKKCVYNCYTLIWGMQYKTCDNIYQCGNALCISIFYTHNSHTSSDSAPYS
jgi:hypothetical protein